jgi:hypothetical protein
MISGLAAGYYGPISLSANPQINPLGNHVPTTVRLTQSEVDSTTAALGMPDFENLNPAQQKMVAAYILQRRKDPTGLYGAQAGQLLAGNPAFQSFEIIAGVAAL